MSSNRYHYPSQPDGRETRPQYDQGSLPPIASFFPVNREEDASDSRGPTYQYTCGPPVSQRTHDYPVFQHFREPAMSQHSNEASYGSPKAESSSSRDDQRSQSQSRKSEPKKLPKFRKEQVNREQQGKVFNSWEDILMNYLLWTTQNKQTSGNANSSGLMSRKQSVIEVIFALFILAFDKEYKEAIDKQNVEQWRDSKLQEVENMLRNKTHPTFLGNDVECRPDKADPSTSRSKYKCAVHKEKNLLWEICRRSEYRKCFKEKVAAYCASKGRPPMNDDEEYEKLLN